jgi:hypothetical protein
MNKINAKAIAKKIMRLLYSRRNWFVNLKSSQKAYFLGNIISLIFFFFFMINASLIYLPNSNIFIKSLIVVFFVFMMLSAILQIFSIKLSIDNYLTLSKAIKNLINEFNSQAKALKVTELIIITLVFITAFLLPVYILIEPFFKNPKLSLYIFLYMMFFGITICTVTLLAESTYFIIRNYESNWFKALVKYMAAISSFISFTLAQISINALTHVSPINFAPGLTLYSILFFPFIWFLLLYFILQFLFISVYLVSLCLALFFQIFSPFTPIIISVRNSWIYRFTLRQSYWNIIPIARNLKILINLFAGRLIGLISVVSLIYFCIVNIQLLFPVIGRIAEQSHVKNPSQILVQALVVTSYQADSAECTNRHQGEWIKLIGDKKMSVAIPDTVKGYQFKVRNCKFP